jgi:hypothetical protein
MATIPLTQGKVAIVDEEDVERCLAYKWYAHKPANRPQAWYARRSDQQKRGVTIYLHRFLLGVPNGVKVDHRDRDPLNCQRSNLRIATNAQNGANRLKQLKRTTSQYKGVHYQKPTKDHPHPRSRPWRASIVRCRNGKSQTIWLGSFASELDAARAYDCAAVLHFGAFAHPNFGRVRPLSTSLAGTTTSTVTQWAVALR